MTTLGKVYIGVCLTGAIIGGTVFGKVASDILGLGEDFEDMKEAKAAKKQAKATEKAAKKAAKAAKKQAVNIDDFEDDDPKSGTDTIPEMMNAQNAAQAADPIQ